MTKGMTNLNKTKAELVFEMLLSLNASGRTPHCGNVSIAITQYDMLVKEGIVKEE